MTLIKARGQAQRRANETRKPVRIVFDAEKARYTCTIYPDAWPQYPTVEVIEPEPSPVYETRAVLAGAYRRGLGSLLTHAVAIHGERERVLCRRVLSANLADAGALSATARAEAPTCPMCRKLDPRSTQAPAPMTREEIAMQSAIAKCVSHSVLGQMDSEARAALEREGLAIMAAECCSDIEAVEVMVRQMGGLRNLDLYAATLLGDERRAEQERADRMFFGGR